METYMCPVARTHELVRGLIAAGFPGWSLAQRAAAPVRNGGKLLCVGFGASMLGVGITNALIWMRSQLNPEGSMEKGQSQNPLVVSSAYATYMATSSNIRYQVLAGVLEERGIEVCWPTCLLEIVCFVHQSTHI